MIDYGWWFICERSDGLPLTPWQFAFWMIVSPIVNLVFFVGFILASVVYGAGSVVLFPYFYFKRNYAEYRKRYDLEKEKTWKALTK